MIFIIYQVCFLIGLIPYLIFRFFTKSKIDLYPKHRLGFGFESIHSPQTIWIHSVSLGETKAAVPIFQQLKEQFPKAQFVITTSTKTGLDEAKKSMPGCLYGFLPYDLSFCIRSFLNKINPRIALFIEGDIWPNLLRHLKKRNIPAFLINAQLSEKSFKRFCISPYFATRIFSCFEIIFAQSQIHKERLEQLGANEVMVTGNIKLANFLVPSGFTREELGIPPEKKVVVLGSTHEGEEELLCNAIESFIDRYHICLFIVPRHPERFSKVENLLKTRKYMYARFSEISKHQLGNYSVILVDQMGLLQKLYAISDFSIVGGSFVKGIGGHNILEPIFAGCAVAFGPYMEAQQELKSIALQYKACLELDHESLKSSLEKIFSGQINTEEYVEQGKNLVGSFQNLLNPIIKRVVQTLTLEIKS